MLEINGVELEFDILDADIAQCGRRRTAGKDAGIGFRNALRRRSNPAGMFYCL